MYRWFHFFGYLILHNWGGKKVTFCQVLRVFIERLVSLTTLLGFIFLLYSYAAISVLWGQWPRSKRWSRGWKIGKAQNWWKYFEKRKVQFSFENSKWSLVYEISSWILLNFFMGYCRRLVLTRPFRQLLQEKQECLMQCSWTKHWLLRWQYIDLVYPKYSPFSRFVSGSCESMYIRRLRSYVLANFDTF